MAPVKRRRLSAEQAKQNILEAAEKRLIEGGPDSVRIQPLARGLGITDAAIHHHFGTREELLAALLRFGGRRLREAVREAAGRANKGPFDIGQFVGDTLAIFGDRGYSRLALWLTAAGWRDRGSGLFDDLALRIEVARSGEGEDAVAKDPGTLEISEEARFSAALIMLTLMAEPVFGRAARRSVTLPGDAATTQRFRDWLVGCFGRLMEPSE